MGQLKRLITYLKEARQEVKKVDWPNRHEVFQKTIIVLVFSAIVTGILGSFDFLFNRGMVTLFSTQGAAQSIDVEDLAPLPDFDVDVNNEPIGVDVIGGEEIISDDSGAAEAEKSPENIEE